MTRSQIDYLLDIAVLIHIGYVSTFLHHNQIVQKPVRETLELKCLSASNININISVK